MHETLLTALVLTGGVLILVVTAAHTPRRYAFFSRALLAPQLQAAPRVRYERELQLAMLVVDRKTNPEIAGELFLSQKTVETHLRNIFRKVGVTSRVELARAVERAQRATGTPS
jgi:DNA-binding NarL/FixJ family response regulator